MSELKDIREDPVCGTILETIETEHTTDYEEKTYYFCSETCKWQFEAAPKAYTKIKAA